MIVEYAYDAWGKLESMTGNPLIGLLNPIRYRGYYYDIETGFYYLQTRYYDPETGRFINADVYASTGQGTLGTNMFSYCLNNPINNYDPSGEKCICLTQRVGPRHVCESVSKAKKTSEKKTIRDVTDEVNRALHPTASAAFVGTQILKGTSSSRLASYPLFGGIVFHKSVWDIKRPKPWEFTIGTSFPGKDVPVLYNGSEVTAEYLGNYAYGFLGYSYGIPLPILYVGSYVAAGCPRDGDDLENEIGDRDAISAGFHDATNYFKY